MILDKIFKQLEEEAIPAEWYNYEIKKTNQIIRANVEPLEQQIKELEEIVKSAISIAARQGESTNWGAFITKAKQTLNK